jgi:type VI secretion system protein ImpB
MAKSFQHEKPPARVNLFLEIKGEDGIQRQELPLRLLVLGDFKGSDDPEPLEDRERINVNKDNFGQVMSSMNIEADLIVPNRLSRNEKEMRVNLQIEDLDSLHPEHVAQQVPVLRDLVAMRNLLVDLRNRVITTRQFRQKLESVVADPAARERLQGDLKMLQPGPSSAD